ncbi:MAG TPA: cytochrome c [Stellaceae bacterium]|jgi:mono/diheme cytochrome c family protein
MRRGLALFAVLALGTASAYAGDAQDFAKIERGRYLAVAGDCAGCHDAPGGGDPMAGGMKIETPFGTVTASNITPYKDSGIGAWTDDEFVRAVSEGIRRDGAHLFPAMPYPYYTKVSRDDLLTIRAYLSTVPVAQHTVGGDDLPFPLDVRAGMAAWNKVNFTAGPFKPDPNQSAERNRGAYLVEGLGHCGACHTPKGPAGGDKTSEAYQGGALQGWFAPEIGNGTPRGLGTWSADEIVAYLKTGHNKFTAAAGPMADVVDRSTSRMTDGDLRAIATYLKTLKGSGNETPKPVAASDKAMKQGAAIFGDECAACHTGHGTGSPRLFPSLAGSSSVQSTDPTSLIRIVLNGTRSVGTEKAPTSPAMPGFGRLLNDGEAAAVLTYIRNTWGNAAPAVNPDQVHDVRKSLTHHNG